MGKESERVKELLKSGIDAHNTIETLIKEGYFPDTKESRRLIIPAVREINNWLNEEKPESKVSKVHKCNDLGKGSIYTHGITGEWLMCISTTAIPTVDTIKYCPYCGEELET